MKIWGLIFLDYCGPEKWTLIFKQPINSFYFNFFFLFHAIFKGINFLIFLMNSEEWRINWIVSQQQTWLCFWGEKNIRKKGVLNEESERKATTKVHVRSFYVQKLEIQPSIFVRKWISPQRSVFISASWRHRSPWAYVTWSWVHLWKKLSKLKRKKI